MTKSYCMVRAMNDNFTLLSRKSVVAIGWSDWDFSALSEDAAVDAWEKHAAKDDVPPNVITKKTKDIRRFYHIQEGDRILIPHHDYVWLAFAGRGRVYDAESAKLDLANQLRVAYLKINGVFCTVPLSPLSKPLVKKLQARGTAVADLNEFHKEIESIFQLLCAQPGCKAESEPPMPVYC